MKEQSWIVEFSYFQIYWYPECTHIVVSKHFMGKVVQISDGKLHFLEFRTATRRFAKISPSTRAAFTSVLDVMDRPVRNSSCMFVRPFLKHLRAIFCHASSADYVIALHLCQFAAIFNGEDMFRP
jgi:hypothetical protein